MFNTTNVGGNEVAVLHFLLPSCSSVDFLKQSSCSVMHTAADMVHDIDFFIKVSLGLKQIIEPGYLV